MKSIYWMCQNKWMKLGSNLCSYGFTNLSMDWRQMVPPLCQRTSLQICILALFPTHFKLTIVNLCAFLYKCWYNKNQKPMITRNWFLPVHQVQLVSRQYHKPAAKNVQTLKFYRHQIQTIWKWNYCPSLVII